MKILKNLSRELRIASTIAVWSFVASASAEALSTSSTNMDSSAPNQEYFVKIQPSSRSTPTFLSDYDSLKSSLQADGATIDLQLAGIKNLYVRFSLPSASIADRQNVLASISQLPLVAQVIAANAANLAIRDIAKVTSYGPNDIVPESSLRGFREKRIGGLPDLVAPHTNEILVKYLQMASYTPALLAAAEDSLAALHKQLGATVKRRIATDDTPIEVVVLPSTVDYGSAILTYETSTVVEYVQPNYIVNLDTTPNDPSWSGTNYSTLVPNSWHLKQINAEGAWSTTTSASGVVVAVVDTGINYNQDDLSGNLWPSSGSGSSCGFNEVGGSDPLDDNSSVYHGTHVSGIIGAVGNNSTEGTGVAWAVKLMAVKSFPLLAQRLTLI